MTKHSKIDMPALSRRHFMAVTGAAGLMVGYAAMPDANQALAGAMSHPKFEPTQWYSIGTDGRVTVVVGKAEMGQHISSTMAQLVAEELGAAWKDMAITLASNDPKYNDPVLGAQITGGSWSTGMNYDAMCRAGAAGRMALIAAAAEMMGVPESQLTAIASHVVDTKSGKKLPFGKIVAGGKANKVFTADELKAIKLKTADQYTIIGHSVPQLDIPPKTNGTAKYGIDAFAPGMVYGMPVTPPVRYGATVKSVDDSEAKKVPGFIRAVVVEDKTGTTTGWVVSVAKTYEAAKKAGAALKIDYDLGPNAKVDDAAILAESRRLHEDGTEGFLFVKEGDAEGALKTAPKVLEAEYTTSINIHAPMEPMNALAMEKDGEWHIYTGNQFFTRTTAIAAAIAGVDPKKIVLHQHFLGGGFGRRLESDMVVPAIAAAKAVGKPVKCIYTREDDMHMDFTRPLTYQHVKLGVDDKGHAVAMTHDVIGAWPTARWGIPAFLTPSVDKKGSHDSFTVNGADYWYTVPNHTVKNFENKLAQAATPSGQLRSVAPGWTFWATESMWDEMAHATGQDPVALRLSMLDGLGDNAGKNGTQTQGGAKRLANVLRIATGRAGYGVNPLPKNEGIGVACVSSQERSSPTWTACVAHVAVNPETGDVTVKKLTLAMDLGTVVNPDGVRAQIEGSALWGMSIALLEKGTLKDGGIEQSNFDTYTPMRMSNVPELDISLIGNGEPAVGCGEPAVTVVAPAIANAIFNAVGARVRSLPITADAVKASMSKV
ncbi:xanthine dehydrogenase family protein molybdopterin-binding subunit [Acidisphaera rubrifaciens]|uniref:Aldehyde dehydrogenase large subunit n=1 Tax=Acidisphaera rubrifaciens HS-AP3 TaxID=1231350 RepID=A0A0D6P889_9PROT|nr:molybdopterin cofactor-binding domain-containing protein [Acidisphaera rubrifaciens]GAN77872.1 aldehyde dehydrogenase large subunit [Acidisphaera rubrifaciens HS-AP3]